MTTMTAPARPVYRLTTRGVLAGEWTKFWSLRSTWITLAVSAFLLVAVGLIAAASFDPADSRGPGSAAGDVVALVLSGSTFGALAVGVLGVLLAAGEYSTGMIRSTLTAVPSRLPVLWSKAAIAGGIAFVVMTAAAFVAFFAGSPLAGDAMATLRLGDDGVLRALFGAGLYLGLVAVFGVALGALVRSSAGGIAILAGLLLIVPTLVMLLPDSWAENITPYLPSNAGSAIMSLTTADTSLGPWTGLAVFAAWVAAALGAAAYRLAKSDA
ncbi:ABC transporter permease [Actinoplanes sp. NPDC026670]|uniref:ABC transporter permease n=1 Tax=Actinoplanes sp. NPDC026670 TaxID=3154700 RepID=UPI0033F8705B